ncbi:M4 family metallopeptidase [Actinoplanes sp. N902-109]|uniref:M4 family metallopeptidase n=1 Tax=Actinoplanes sp. (strain N902-109) TaxID=649831 RepID=UPI000329358B|nr:M4 family metallopeptidase [Actinoplanes sp. N902-109]AGL19195.1 thermolysin [Actinoplanes sp. N902-109]
MRRTLASTGTIAVVLGLAAGVPAAAQGAPSGGDRVPDRAAALARADQAVSTHRAAIKGADGEKYIAGRTVIDASGASHARYSRTYRGLPVRGGDFVVHSDAAGRFAGADVAQSSTISLPSTTPEKTAEQAVDAAERGFAGTLTGVLGSTLIVDAVRTPRLAWRVRLSGTRTDGQTPSKENVIVDASTGAVLQRWDDVRVSVPDEQLEAAATAPAPAARVARTPAKGTGLGIYNGAVPLDTQQDGNSYALQDPTRGNNATCTFGNNTSSCSILWDSDNAWGNGTQADRTSAGVDAHYAAAQTWDYFTKVHQRTGIRGDGNGVRAQVHYGWNYTNAYWDGQSATFGDGRDNANPLVALDVVAHELSHGLTDSLAGLEYNDDAGGLNESTSDIFGSMVEFAANNPNDPGDYDIGEEINLYGNGKPLRFMYQPSLDGRSFDCYQFPWPDYDPHYTSGPGNHFFYLLAEGTSGGVQPSPTCNGSTVTGIGRERAAKIWFRALDAYFTSTESYRGARRDTLKAAADLYGMCGAEYQAVQTAWSAVNVSGSDAVCTGPASPPPATLPPVESNYFSNTTRFSIPDGPIGEVVSPITVAHQPTSPHDLKVKVLIYHGEPRDLVVDVIAPDGTVYNVHNREYGYYDSIDKTYVLDVSSKQPNGVWNLRVRDKSSRDTGTIDSWSLQF